MEAPTRFRPWLRKQKLVVVGETSVTNRDDRTFDEVHAAEKLEAIEARRLAPERSCRGFECQPSRTKALERRCYTRSMIDGLDGLDDTIFARLTHAYGSAADTPRELRTLGSSDLEAAHGALRNLGASIYHQGSYYDATAPSVPFLIKLVETRVRACAEILLFLGDMAGAPAEVDLAYDPFVFRSSPGAPRYPEAVATIEAIRHGAPVYRAALADERPGVRTAAAYTAACLKDPEAATLLANAIEREPNDATRTALVFALERLGGTRLLGDFGGDVARVLRADLVHATRDDLATLKRLLLAPAHSRAELPFWGGKLASFAAYSLAQAATDDAFATLARALAVRLARGERLEEKGGRSLLRVGDEAPRESPALDDSNADDEDDDRGAALRTIATAMTQIAFGPKARDSAPLCVADLDERQRMVLELTRDHGIPVPVAGAPFPTRAEMARFLTNEGLLTRGIAVDGKRAPIHVHLRRLAPDDPELETLAESVMAEAARVLTPAELLELALEIHEGAYGLGPYGAPAPAIAAALDRHVLPIAAHAHERLATYAAELAQDLTTASVQAVSVLQTVGSARARFALLPWILASEPVPESVDSVAARAISYDGKALAPWLATFPEPRRSRIVASYGNRWLLDTLRAVCTETVLTDALVEAFSKPDCRWLALEATRVLETIADTSRLESLRDASSGRRRKLVERVLRARSGEGTFTLKLDGKGGLRATLLAGEKKLVEAVLPADLTKDHLVPFVAACSVTDEPTVQIAGKAPHARADLVARVLLDAGLKGRVSIPKGGTLSNVD